MDKSLKIVHRKIGPNGRNIEVLFRKAASTQSCMGPKIMVPSVEICIFFIKHVVSLLCYVLLFTQEANRKTLKNLNRFYEIVFACSLFSFSF